MKPIRHEIDRRKWELSKDYDYVVEMLLEDKNRDYFVCYLCGKPTDCQLHHKKYRSQISAKSFIEENGLKYHRDSWRNLIPLCYKCHLYEVHEHTEKAKEKGL